MLPRRRYADAMRLLHADEVTAQLGRHDHWQHIDDRLCCEFTFDDARQAQSVAAQVAEESEEMQHPCETDVAGRKVTFLLTSPDAGGVTQQDVELAFRIDRLLP